MFRFFITKSIRFFAFIFLMTSTFTACLPSVDFTSDSTKAAVKAASGILQSPDGQALFRDAGKQITDGVVASLMGGIQKGALAGVSDEGRKALEALQPQLEALTKKIVLAGGQSLQEVLKKNLLPLIKPMVRAGFDAGLQSMSMFMVAHGDEIAFFLRKNLVQTSGEMAHEIGKQLILGLQEGQQQSAAQGKLFMREIAHELGAGFAEGLADSVKKSPLEPVLLIINAVLGLLLLVALSVFGILLVKYRRLKRA